MVMKEARWGAVSPGSGWSIPLFRAEFPRFGSKTVEHSRYLPQGKEFPSNFEFKKIGKLPGLNAKLPQSK
jgi:hypothetical protein